MNTATVALIIINAGLVVVVGLVLYWATKRSGPVITHGDRRDYVDPTERLVYAVELLGRVMQEKPELSDDVKLALRQFRKTSIDIQGVIELLSRYLVMQMPDEVVRDMGPPIEWGRLDRDRQGAAR